MTGREIVAKVLTRHRLGKKDFFGASRLPRIVQVRREAIHSLRAAGFSIERTARIVRRNYSTVEYHANSRAKHRRLSRAKRLWAQRGRS